MRKKLIYVVIFFFSLVVFFWTNNKEIINGNDTTYPLRPVEYFKQRLYQWNHTIGGGIDFAHGSAGLTWHGLQAFTSLLGRLPVSQKIFIFIIFNLISFSFYFFISQLLPKDRLSCIVGVIFYCFNPYLFNLWGNIQSANLTAYAFIPLASGFLIKLLCGARKPFLWLISFGILSVLLSAFGQNPQVAAVVFIYFCFLVGFLFLELVIRTKRIRFRNFSAIVLNMVFVYLIFNLFWIIPLLNVLFSHNLSLEIPSAENLRGWLDFVSKNSSVVNILRMQGEWMWYQTFKGKDYIPFAKNYQANVFLIFWSFVAFSVSIWTLVRSKNRWTVFLGSILFIGLLASVGTRPPFGYLYLFLSEKIKALSFFRSPWYKFSLLTAIAYSVFAAFFVSDLTKWKKLFFVLLCAGQLFYSYPLLTGEVFPTKGAVLPFKYSIPEYIWLGDKFFREDWKEGKIVVLPREGDLDYYQWGGNSSAQFLNLFANPKPVLTEPSWTVVGDTSINKLVSSFYDHLYNTQTSRAIKILAPLNVEYLLHKEDYAYNFDKDLGSPQFLKGKIINQEYLEKPVENASWKIYPIEKEFAKPFIYAENKIDVVDTEPYLLASYFLARENNGISISSSDINRFNERESNFLFQQYGVGFLREKIPNYQPNVPYAHFLPGNPFYYFARFREEKQIDGITGFLEKATMFAFYGGKRLEEVKAVCANESRKDSVVKRLLTDYFENIRQLENILDNSVQELSREKIEPLILIQYYSEENLKKLTFLEENGINSESFAEMRKLTKLVQEKSLTILNKYVSSSTVKRFSLFTPQEGIYKFLLLTDEATSSAKGVVFDLSTSVNNQEFAKSAKVMEKGIVDLGDYQLTDKSNTVDIFFPHAVSSSPDLVVKKERKPLSGFSLPGVEFTQTNPTEYQVRVVDTRSSFVLVFSENFHPWWKAEIISADGKKQKISEKNHLKVNGFANGWILDTKGDFEVVIKYKSQKIYQFLLTITAILITLSLFIVVFWLPKKKYEK